MAGNWRDGFAALYDACARAGLANPREVDRLELWEVAAVLGLDKAPQEGVGVPVGQRDIVAERLYAHEHGLPPPQPDPPQHRDPRIGTLIPFGKQRGA